ncbi:MAG: hypothetical protein KAI72_10805 [Candidatus Pacebacteria bacterium]|nr:hypothetical protein [Candidatus Paceibacterota bacterium]
MSKTGPFIMATVSQRTTKCGNKKCACVTDERKRHPTFRISWTDSKGDGCCYVPKDIQGDVEGWIENYWTMKEYMKEMTELSRRMIKMYAKTLGRVKKKQEKQSKKEQSKSIAKNSKKK